MLPWKQSSYGCQLKASKRSIRGIVFLTTTTQNVSSQRIFWVLLQESGSERPLQPTAHFPLRLTKLKQRRARMLRLTLCCKWSKAAGCGAGRVEDGVQRVFSVRQLLLLLLPAGSWTKTRFLVLKEA